MLQFQHFLCQRRVVWSFAEADDAVTGLRCMQQSLLEIRRQPDGGRAPRAYGKLQILIDKLHIRAVHLADHTVDLGAAVHHDAVLEIHPDLKGHVNADERQHPDRRLVVEKHFVTAAMFEAHLSKMCYHFPMSDPNPNTSLKNPRLICDTWKGRCFRNLNQCQLPYQCREHRSIGIC
jgi:hypothetical protein